MSGAFGSSQWAYSSGVAGYQIEDSLRFEDGSSAYLNRTPAAAGNRTTWTFSCWVKRGNLSTSQDLLSYYVFGLNETIQITNTNTILRYCVDTSGTVNRVLLQTNAVIRDPSAWYHIVITEDTTEATNTDRVKIYVNGVQQTINATVWPALNWQSYINSTVPHSLGGTQGYFDGYLSDVHFIDGQALDPTSFGETIDGYWRPIPYAGTYGTNGFHLDFNGNTNDASGNGNDWTANNISAHDYVPDSPTNNFATLNVLTKGTSNLTLAEGNLKANAIASGSGSNWGTVFSSIPLPTTGKYYVEGLAFINAGVGNNSHLGVLDTSSFAPSHSNITYAYTTGEGFDGIYVSLFNNNARPVSDGVLGTAEGSLTGTTVVAMLAVDIDNGKVWAGYNGTWLNSGNPSAGTNEIATRTFSDNDAIAVGTAYTASNAQGMLANFGQDSTFAGATTAGGNQDDNGIGDFAYPVPSGGYLALCTANLPEPTIVDGSQHFNTVLYTGDGAASKSITSVNFKPDLNWVKQRNIAQSHTLTDIVRGAGFILSSNATSADYSATTYGQVTSFDTDGFTVSKGSDPTYSYYNQSGGSYAAWNWKAGGAAVSNTAGSITSQVSANVDAGFSIVTFSNGSGNTIGHGLSATPELIIEKRRSSTADWLVGTTIIDGSYDYLRMNLTNAAANSAVSAPTSTVFYPNTGSGDVVAYCFHSVDGYSKVGSYTGNGSTDGTYIHLGFRPSFIMYKRTDTATSWGIFDSARSGYNVANDSLAPNLSDAEYSGATYTYIDLLSNGFKWRRTDSTRNASGGTYIYLAFAETPFKYANAR